MAEAPARRYAVTMTALDAVHVPFDEMVETQDDLLPPEIITDGRRIALEMLRFAAG